MQLLSKLFSKKTNDSLADLPQQDLPIIPSQQETIAVPLKQTYPQLTTLSTLIRKNEFFSSLALPVKELLTQTELSSSQVHKIIESLQQLMVQLDSQLNDCTITNHVFTQYISQCKKIAKDSFAISAADYESYNMHEELSILEQQLEISNYILKIAGMLTPEETIAIEELVFLLKELCNRKQEIDNYLPSFLTLEETLKSDIESYSIAVADASSKHKLSPDWSGKKQPLINYGAALQKRREEFVKQESILNQKISTLYDAIPNGYDLFQQLIPIMITLLEIYLKEHTEDSKIAKERVRLGSLYEVGTSMLGILTSLKS